MEAKTLQFDVAVIGGGQAGTCAAIAAAQEGCRTVLVNDRPVIGGNASSECGVPPHGAEAMGHNRNCRDTGLLEEMRLDYYLRRSPDSDSRAHWDLILLERCRAEPNLTLLLNTRITGCAKDGRRITSVRGHCLATATDYIIAAPVFVDATGDGFLAYSAGVPFRWGRESKHELGETVLGREQADRKTLGSTVYGWAIKRDYHVAYSPPAWAARYPDCRSLAHRPHTARELFPTVTASKDHRSLQFFWWLEWGGQLDVIQDQAEIYHRLLAELFGVWDHLKNSCDAATRKALESFELHRWSLFPLRRESRRIEGAHILREADLFDHPLFEDRIGFGGWPPDDHPPDGIASPDPPCNQVFLHEPYSVPYGCFYSKDLDNMLLAGRCLSASHVALSSVRLMNTLGSLGEAVGTAAAVCAQSGRLPRDLAGGAVRELQQRILDRDLYLIGMANRSPRDLALGASVDVSSTLPLACGPSLGFAALRLDTALQIPISSERVDLLEVYLKAESAATVTWQVSAGRELGKPGSDMVAEGRVAVQTGERWYTLDLGRSVSRPAEAGRIWTVMLRAAESVAWAYGAELFQTRWGVRYGTSRVPRSYHGAARIAPTDNPWLFVNHHGRLPEDLEEWIAPMPGPKVHGKLYATPLFHIEPAQHPYGGANLINGFGRAESWPNIWISEPGLPQWLRLRWEQPVEIGRIELVFDTQLDYADQMYGFPRSERDFAIPCPVTETVKAYRIEVLQRESWTVVARVADNYQRRRIHRLDPALRTREVRVVIEQTWGSETARVFQVRVFA